MKQPKAGDLKLNKKETQAVRVKAQTAQSIKITINIDADTLQAVREKADETSVPYQRLINNLLRSALADNDSTIARLERLEKEVRRMKGPKAA